MLHITNGSSVSISQAGIEGRVVFWNDVLHEGPVPNLPLEELSEVRSNFIVNAFGLSTEQASQEFEERDAALRGYGDEDELVLWFEHDLYDQLQLIQILDWVAAHRAPNTRTTLIQTDVYLGPMKAAELTALFPNRRVITEAQFGLARRAWAAFTAPDPAGLLALMREDTSALPHLASAFRRHLEQFPSTRNGLSRTQQQIMTAVASGAKTLGAAFAIDATMEERVFMGDSSFINYVRELGSCRSPLLNVDEHGSVMKLTLALTAKGREVLDGREDHIRLNGIDRWLGGIHLSSPDCVWRYDGVALVR